MSGVTKKKALRVVLDLFHEIEHGWEDHPGREDMLTKLRDGLAALKSVPDIDPHIPALSRHLHKDIELPHLCGILVPVEREYETTNITDEHFLITVDDHDSDRPAGGIMPVTVILDNIRSAFNTGGIFRSCECLGIERIILCGYSASPENEKVVRAAMGTCRHIKWETANRAEDAIDRLRSSGTAVYALETAADAPTCDSVSYPFPCSIVVGNERFGLSQTVLSMASGVVRIPTYGCKNSLNVVSALTVCGYAIRKRWEEENSRLAE